MLPKRLRPPITVEDGKVHVGIALALAILTILFSGTAVFAITGFGANNPAPFNTSGIPTTAGSIPTPTPYIPPPTTSGGYQVDAITVGGGTPSITDIAPTPTITNPTPSTSPFPGTSQQIGAPTPAPVPSPGIGTEQTPTLGGTSQALLSFPTYYAPPDQGTGVYQIVNTCPTPDVQQSQIAQMVATLYQQCLSWGQQCNAGSCAIGDCEAKCAKLAQNDSTLETQCRFVMCNQETQSVVQPMILREPEPALLPEKKALDCPTLCKEKSAQTITTAFDLNQCLNECSGQVKTATYSPQQCLALCEEAARECGQDPTKTAQQCNTAYGACAAQCN